MANFVIPALVVLAFLFLMAWYFKPKQAAWMPADAMLQLHREIRRPPRIPFKAPVTIRSHSGTETISAESQDLAVGGMLLRPAVPLAVGQPVRVAFDLPSGESIDIPAVVCRTVGPSFGIRFDVMDQQRTKIAEWVESNRKPA